MNFALESQGFARISQPESVNKGLLLGALGRKVQRLAARRTQSIPRFRLRACSGKRDLTVSAQRHGVGSFLTQKAGQKCPQGFEHMAAFWRGYDGPLRTDRGEYE
jgi:hypothetical protein